ncbi:MAG: HAD family hydrolase, partial [candidate division Zixibacteria bacterium]|nr:HAD family hydrolase [candidate division Zixibacteria bacterium]
MTIKNLIFDLDGTLIDSSAGVVDAVNYSLKMVGSPQQEARAIKKFIGYSLATMYPHFTDAPYGELYRHFRVRAAEVIVRSAVLLPDVAEILQYLHGRGYRMAIATTKVRSNIDGIIDKFQWHP